LHNKEEGLQRLYRAEAYLFDSLFFLHAFEAVQKPGDLLLWNGTLVEGNNKGDFEDSWSHSLI